MVAIWPGSATYASHRSSSGSSHQLPSLFNQSIHEKHKEHRQFKMRERERDSIPHKPPKDNRVADYTGFLALAAPIERDALLCQGSSDAAYASGRSDAARWCRRASQRFVAPTTFGRTNTEPNPQMSRASLEPNRILCPRYHQYISKYIIIYLTIVWSLSYLESICSHCCTCMNLFRNGCRTYVHTHPANCSVATRCNKPHGDT